MTVLTDRLRILVVDDDSACRVLLNTIFTLNGFHVTETDSVLGASELITSFRPDVIVLDLALPYRSGASWLAQIKADPVTMQIPVIVLSALPEALPRARRQLAQAVIRKPFRTAALLHTIQAVCGGGVLIDGVFTVESESSQPLGSL